MELIGEKSSSPAMFHVGMAPEDVGVTVTGGLPTAEKFMVLFGLPAKIG